ncbi:LOW QUALITY PROTEIN: RING finger protein 32 [Cariama cristata]
MYTLKRNNVVSSGSCVPEPALKGVCGLTLCQPPRHYHATPRHRCSCCIGEDVEIAAEQLQPQRGHFSKQEMIAVSAVALQDHIIQSHQLQDLSLADPFKSRTRNTKNIYKPVSKVIFREVVDTGLRKKSSHRKNKEDAEKEYVLDPSPPQLTLAQKSGLAEPPSLPLAAEGWVKVKQRSIHEDSIQPCAVWLLGFFSFEKQVLLICSHVSHIAWLKAFEKFTGKKSCPMCRKEQYQTRVIHDGARLFKIKCTIKIQASWKGYIVSKWYKNLRKTVAPKDGKLRKQFLEKKVQQISNRLLSSSDINLNEFFPEIDSSIAASRDVFLQLEGKEILLISETDWEKIQMQAFQEIFDCPICIMPLSPNVHPASFLESNHFSQQAVLLSCSHLFHHICLQAFEDFSLGERHICPLCC